MGCAFFLWCAADCPHKISFSFCRTFVLTGFRCDGQSPSSPSLVLLRTKSHSLIYHSGRRRSVDNASQTKVAYAASPEVRARPLIFATCAHADAVTFNSLYCRPLSIQVDILLSVFAVRPQPAAELLLTFSVFCIANVNLTLLTLSVYLFAARKNTQNETDFIPIFTANRQSSCPASAFTVTFVGLTELLFASSSNSSVPLAGPHRTPYGL